MIKIENTEVYGWEAAIRGARNPMNSWDKSDSGSCKTWDCQDCGYYKADPNFKCGDREDYILGQNDQKLLQNLAHAGPDHGKFLRMITVTMDITAPFYFWKEFSTYKVGTVANSCSTMHKIHAKEFTLEDFSHEHLTPLALSTLEKVVDMLNNYRADFTLTHSKDDWWQMIQLLPSSYNQRRTVQLNYQVLKSMYHARKNHKLDEWRDFCDFVRNLPYAELIIDG